ncbi:MAG: DNA polymerase III subunit gamma/tau, partial [Dehalococcoidia bacterium]
VNFAPNSAKYKVYIIDEVHMLSTSAFNALLKTLEEPPAHVIFVLATTEVHKVPATISSRCQRFDFRRIPQDAIVKRLDQICHEEGIKAESKALQLIARTATGSLRDAENLLEQMVVYHGPRIELQDVQSELGLTGDARIKGLIESILAKDMSRGLTTINDVANDGLDLRQFNRELVDYLRNMLLVKANASGTVGLTDEEIEEMERLGEDISLDELSQVIKLFSQVDFRYSPQSTLPLEIALVDYSLSGSEPQPKSEKKAKPQAKDKQETNKTEEPKASTQTQESIDSDEPTIASEPDEAEPEAAVPSEPQTIPRPEGVSELEHIQQHWNDFIKACKDATRKIDALLRRSCRPVSIENNTLVLGFYTDSFQKRNLEKSDYKRALEEKLEQVFGKRYNVRYTVVGKGDKPPPPTKENPLVKEAMARGARIMNEER